MTVNHDCTTGPIALREDVNGQSVLNVHCNDKPTFKTVKVFDVLSTKCGNLSSSSTFTCKQQSGKINLEAAMYSIGVKTGF